MGQLEHGREKVGADEMPPTLEAEPEVESRTQFTSKGTIPPPLLGNEPAQAKSASDMAFGSPVDPATWSKQQADALRAARSRVHRQQLALIVDDRCTTLALTFARGVMAKYEKNWTQAKKNFESGIGRELEVAAKRRETADFLMGVALGALPQKLAFDVLKKLVDIKDNVEGTVNALNIEKSGFGTHGKSRVKIPDDSPAKAEAPDVTQVDWSQLVDQLFASKDAFNSSLGGLTELDHEYDAMIDKLTDGALGPESELAPRLESLAGFNLPEPVGSFGAASDFLQEVELALGDKGILDIEREMAIHWIAELKPHQIDSLDDVNGYLMQIGVTGPRSQKGLSFDGGLKLHDNEEQLLWHKARVHLEIQDLIGMHAEWLGGRRVGNKIMGRVRINGNVYSASAQAADDKCYDVGQAVTEQAGGSVQIVKSKHALGGLAEPVRGVPFGAVRPDQALDHLRLGSYELVVVPDGGNWDTNASYMRAGKAD